LATRFSCFVDMIAGVEIENGSFNPDHAPFRVVCYPSARIWYSLHVYKIWWRSFRPFQRCGWRPPEFKWLTWPDHAPFMDVIRGIALAVINLSTKFEVF